LPGCSNWPGIRLLCDRSAPLLRYAVGKTQVLAQLFAARRATLK
jgi:hypothetical protein